MTGVLTKRLLALTGLDAKLRHVRVAAGEGALAAEDRAQLLRLAWEEEKQRLHLITLLVVAVMGLTTVAVALLSVAVVVHFWDTPHRSAAAWTVAIVWAVVWLGFLLWLVKALRSKTEGIDLARREFARDWHWVQAQIGSRPRDPALREPRPANRDELLARMERQRERILRLQNPLPGSGASMPQEAPLSQMVTQTLREHPVATAAVAFGVVAAVGPRRLLRMATWALPLFWKLR
ncbi:phage holin family protein [Variovorax sp. OV329]|uniref:phage holin family protein n=1 Tax=Variovorax sp. OV329 TaxID=1882825 RepID=UPI0008EE0B9E|nr:phage holin family protein [Variovorax sp. OV329]SFM40560.1 Putative Holin-X, holin superfamily III [Variovorax sp. OV329]